MARRGAVNSFFPDLPSRPVDTLSFALGVSETEMTVLYQILKRLILPPGFLILLLVVGFTFSFLKFRRLGRVILAVGILFLYLLSISPTADLLLTPLESQY
ncbi:MAG: hypothetical protein OEU80_11330, partial [Deltaproteobacteria bacterium]|nr:hypothetical protein [Deltaproteobacteria bacterium]